MAYVKQTFIAGNILTAAQMNQIEENIESVGPRSIADLTALRDAGIENLEAVNLQGRSTVDDGGQGLFVAITGQPPATYTDNGGTVIVPNGGDGSAAWLRQYNGKVHVAWFGANETQTAATNTASIEGAIVAAGAQGDIEFNPVDYDVNTIDVTLRGVGFWGSGESNNARTALLGQQDAAPIVNVNESQFHMHNISVTGLSDTVEKGEDITQDAVRLAATGNNDNLDAVFENCVFLFARNCVDFHGRNVRFNNCLFSNSKVGILKTDAVTTDMRDLEVYSCRFHSMGKDGASDEACIRLYDGGNFQEVVISGCMADDCKTWFRGFASNTLISGCSHTKMRGQAFVVNASAHTLNSGTRSFKVDGFQANGMGAAASISQTTPCFFFQSALMLPELTDCTVMHWGGDGFEINCNDAILRDCIGRNCGQQANATYPVFDINGTRVNVIGCVASQDIPNGVTNNAASSFDYSDATSTVTTDNTSINLATVPPDTGGIGGGSGSSRVSVKDFGAVGDGVTNDATAFQNALDAAVGDGSQTNGVLYIPQGRYLINSRIEKIATSFSFDIAVIGDGTGLSEILVNNSAGGFNFEMQNRDEQVTFTGLTFLAMLDNSGTAIRVTNAPGGNQHRRAFIATHLAFQTNNGTSNYFDIAIDVNGPWRPLLFDCLSTGPFAPGATNVYAATAVFRLNDCYKPTIKACQGWSADVGIIHEVTIDPGAEGFNMEDTTFAEVNTGVIYDTSGGIGQAEPEFLIRGCHINGQQRGIVLNRRLEAHIVNNLLYTTNPGNVYKDIELIGSTDIVITGNIFQFPAGPVGTRTCVDVDATCVNVLITDNIFQRAENAVEVASGADNVRIGVNIYGPALTNRIVDNTNSIQYQEDHNRLTSGADNNTQHPKFFLNRESASPAAGDVLGAIIWEGRDSALAKQEMATINVEMTDHTAGSLDTMLRFFVLGGGGIMSPFQILSDGVRINNSPQIQSGAGAPGSTPIDGSMYMRTSGGASSGLYARQNGVWEQLGSGGTTDHGGLTGLGDDDHTQYHNDARGDARYSQLGHTHTREGILVDAPTGTAATDTAAAQAALDAVPAAGSRVIFREGEYVLNAQLTLSNKPVTVVGQGIGVTTLRWTSGAASVGFSISQDTDIYFTGFSHMSLLTEKAGTGTAILIDGSGQISGGFVQDRTTPRVSNHNLYIGGVTGPNVDGWNIAIDLDDCQITNNDTIKVIGHHSGAVTNIISDNAIQIRGSGVPTENTLHNIHAFFVDVAVETRGTVEGIILTSSNFVAVTKGVYCHTDSTRPAVLMSGTHVSAFEICVQVTNASQSTIANCLFYTRSDAVMDLIGIALESASQLFVIHDNIFNNNNATYDFDAIVLSGGAGTKDNIIHDNLFQAVTTGVWLQAGVIDNYVANNTFDTVPTFRIRDDSGATTNVLQETLTTKNFLNNYRSIEINSLGTGNRTATLDLHSSDTYTDYSARVIRQSGTNGRFDFQQRGTGQFRFEFDDVNGGHEMTATTLELNVRGTGNRTATLDLHSNDTHTDYAARVIRQSGTNGRFDFQQRGTGQFRFEFDDVNGGHELNATAIEVNSRGTGDRNAIVDLHSDDTNTDYGTRLIRNSGVNGTFEIIQEGTGYINTKYNDLNGGHEFRHTSIELNANGTGDRHAFIDLHSDDTFTDYGARIIKWAGVSGTFDIEVAGVNSIHFMQNSSRSARFNNSQGFEVGLPTGAVRGVGTIRMAGDIYQNATAYTHPDYVFEYEYTGKVEKFAENPGAKEYEGRMALDALRKYTEENLRLPNIHDQAMGAFERSDKVLEKIEELTLYVLELHDRIKKLEGDQ